MKALVESIRQRASKSRRDAESTPFADSVADQMRHAAAIRDQEADFAEKWEADHPACNATRGQVEEAARSAYRRGWADRWDKGMDCQPGRGVRSFLCALGQEPPAEVEDPKDKRIAEMEASFRVAAEQRDNAYKERDEAKGRVSELETANEELKVRADRLRQTVAAEAVLGFEGLRKERDEARAEVERLKHREQTDLDAIANGLDRDDTLGASIRRLREENERLKAQNVTEEDIRAVCLVVAWRADCHDTREECIDRGVAKFRELQAAKGEQAEESQDRQPALTFRCGASTEDCSCYPECGIRLTTRDRDGAEATEGTVHRLERMDCPKCGHAILQPELRDDADVEAIAEAAAYALATANEKRDPCVTPREMQIVRDAALAEARKRKPHGTWVPFEVGDRVVLVGETRDLKRAGVNGFPVQSIMIVICGTCYPPEQLKLFPPEPEEENPPTCGCGACVRSYPVTPSVLHWSYRYTETNGERREFRIADGQHCPDCGEKLVSPTAETKGGEV
jgi:hypothetical protein